MSRPYSVKYGIYNPNPQKIVWAVITGVREDSVLPSGSHRAFLTTSGERVEIPTTGMVFVFSVERQQEIDRRASEGEGKP